ncbi:hypothetical protein Aperf_G00000030786 [Anoplocephala perfoliata]
MSITTTTRMAKRPLAAVGFEPTPFRTGALNRRLRPLGHATDTPLLYSLPTPQTALHATSLLITTPSSSPPSSNQPPSGHLTSRTFKLTQHHDAALRPEAGLELTRPNALPIAPRRPLPTSSRLLEPFLSSTSSTSSIHAPYSSHPRFSRAFTYHSPPNSTSTEEGAATPPLLSNLQSLPTPTSHKYNHVASHRIASHRISCPHHNGHSTTNKPNSSAIQEGRRGCSDGDRSATLPIPHYSTPLPTPQTTLHATSLLITTPSSSPPSSNQPPSGHLTSRTFKLTQHHDAALRPEAGLELTRPNALTDCATEATPHLLSSLEPFLSSTSSTSSIHAPTLPSSVQPRIHLPFPTQLHLYRGGAATPPLLSNLQSLPTSNFSQIQPRRIASHRIASHRINRSATLPIPHYSTPLPTPQTTLHATSLLITTPSSSPPSSNQPPSGHLTSRTFKLTQHHDAALRPEAGLELTRPNALTDCATEATPHLLSSSRALPLIHLIHLIHPRTYSSHPRFSRAFTYHSPPNSTSTEEELPHHHSSLTSNPSQPPTSHKYNHVASHRIASHRIASVAHITMATLQQTNPTRLQFRRGGRGCSDGGDCSCRRGRREFGLLGHMHGLKAERSEERRGREMRGNGHGEAAHRSATLPIPHYSTPLPTPQTTLHATSLLITTPSSSPPSSNQPPSGHLTSRTFKLTQHHDAALRPEAGLELTRPNALTDCAHGGHSSPPLVFSSPSSHPPHPPHPSTHLLLPSSVQPRIHLPFPTQLHLYRGGAATPPLLSNLQSLPTSNFSQIQPRRIASHRIASHRIRGEDVDAAMAVIVVAEEEGGSLDCLATCMGLKCGGRESERAGQSAKATVSACGLDMKSDLRAWYRSATLPIPHYSTPLPTPQTTLHATSLLITTPSSSPPSSNQPPSGHLTSRTFKLTQHHDAALRPEAGLELTRPNALTDCATEATPHLLSSFEPFLSSTSSTSSIHAPTPPILGSAAHSPTIPHPTPPLPNRSATLPIPHYSTPLPTPQTALHATSLLITTPSSSPPSSNQPPSGHLTSRTFKLTQHHDAALRPEAGLELTRPNALTDCATEATPHLLSSSQVFPPHPTSSIHAPTPPILGSAAHSPTIPHPNSTSTEEEPATPPLLSNLQSLPTSNFSQIQPRRIAIASHRIASVAHITMATLQQTNPTRLQFRRGGRGCSDGGDCSCRRGRREFGLLGHMHGLKLSAAKRGEEER